MREPTLPNGAPKIIRPQVEAIIIMGVCGTGKSTIARLLAAATGWKYLDADDYHPAANVAKMRRNLPLDDTDRRPWLDRLAATLRRHAAAGAPVVLACSAIKQIYRDHLASSGSALSWVFLHGSAEILQKRLLQRPAHFMSADMLLSQLSDLEPPAKSAALWVDVQNAPATIVEQIRAFIFHL